MMNKSRIEWTEFTWNPITGCRHGCQYCYARRQAQRFCGDIRLNKTSEQLRQTEDGLWILEEPFRNNQGKVIPLPVGFEPLLHRYRLPMPAQKKKPANIFVCSMADLFGEWVPDEWIREVLAACAAAPWHNYLFLTKNPERYLTLAYRGLLPEGDGFWWGATITNQDDYDRKGLTLFNLPKGCRTFFSIEPLQGPIAMGLMPEWLIIGAETGAGAKQNKPKREWIENIRCQRAGEYIFMKNSLLETWEDPLIQEYPEQLRPKEVIIPHCDKCEHLKTTERHYDPSKDVTAMNHFCTAERLHKRIEGRYARTSPPWCHKRGGGDQ